MQNQFKAATNNWFFFEFDGLINAHILIDRIQTFTAITDLGHWKETIEETQK